jgi:hypothetical protein
MRTAFQVTLRNDETGGTILVGTVAEDRIGAEQNMRQIFPPFGLTITDISPVR